MDPVFGAGEDRAAEGVKVIDGLGPWSWNCENEMVFFIAKRGIKYTVEWFFSVPA